MLIFSQQKKKPNFRYLYDGFIIWAKDLWLSLTGTWQEVALTTDDFIEYASSSLSSMFIYVISPKPIKIGA